MQGIYYLFVASLIQIRKVPVPDLPIVIRPRPTLLHNMWWLYQLRELPDVVFLPCPVTRRAAAENRGMIIFWQWYTSGKLLFARKSDLAGTAIR